MKPTIPISDIVPLVQWIQAYHNFRAKFDSSLRQTGLSPVELHHQRLGPEDAPGVWRGKGYRIYVGPLAVSFEVPEDVTPDQALAAFDHYQTRLFKPEIEDT
jgi:hypothetical protein